MNRKLTDLLSVCRKAGKAKLGFDASKEAIEKRKAFLILLAADISAKTEKEIRFFADKQNVPVVSSGCDMESFFRGIGKRTGVIAICDEGFSKRMSEIISLANEHNDKNSDKQA